MDKLRCTFGSNGPPPWMCWALEWNEPKASGFGDRFHSVYGLYSRRIKREDLKAAAALGIVIALPQALLNTRLKEKSVRTRPGCFLRNS